MRKFFREFREFIQRGNVLDLAVGIIIGGAFGKIVSSLVNDIIMPLVGSVGGVNVQEAAWVLVPEVVDGSGDIIKSAVTLNYGMFIQNIIDFLIIAFSVFVIIKVVKAMQNRAEKAKELLASKEEEVEKVEEEVVEEEPKPTTEELLSEIRDLLKENKETA